MGIKRDSWQAGLTPALEGISGAHAGALIGPRSDQKEISRQAAKTAKNENLFESGPSEDSYVAQVSTDSVPSSSFAALRLGVRSSSVENVPSIEPGQRPRVSLTVIARDEEVNLPKCLESVRGLFDEIVVIDTGSHDRTAEIARSFGAQVFDFPWIDDFAAAAK